MSKKNSKFKNVTHSSGGDGKPGAHVIGEGDSFKSHNDCAGTVDKEVDKLIRACITSRNYVDPSIIADKIDHRRLRGCKLYIQIQRLHKSITASLICYFSLNPICFLNDVIAFVLNNTKLQSKKDKCDNVGELGMGDLRKHPVMVEHFGVFDDSYCPVDITVKDLIKEVASYHWKKKKTNAVYMRNCDWKLIKFEFNKHIREKRRDRRASRFFTSEPPAIGIYVDYREIVYKLGYDRLVSNAVEEIKAEYTESLKSNLMASLASLQRSSEKPNIFDMVSKCCDMVDIKQEYQWLYNLLNDDGAAVSSTFPFNTQMISFFANVLPCTSICDRNEEVDMNLDNVLSMLSSDNGAATMLLVPQTQQHYDRIASICCATLILLMQNVKLRTESNDVAMIDRVVEVMRDQLFEDIPECVFISMRRFLEADLRNIISHTLDAVTKDETLGIDVSFLVRRFRSLFHCHQKPKRLGMCDETELGGMRLDNYVGCAATCVLFCRLYKTQQEKDTLCRVDQIEAIISRSADIGDLDSSEYEAIAKQLSVDSLTLLESVYQSLLTTLHVPSFECVVLNSKSVAPGSSFFKYLLNNPSKNLLAPLFRSFILEYRNCFGLQNCANIPLSCRQKDLNSEECIECIERILRKLIILTRDLIQNFESTSSPRDLTAILIDLEDCLRNEMSESDSDVLFAFENLCDKSFLQLLRDCLFDSFDFNDESVEASRLEWISLYETLCSKVCCMSENTPPETQDSSAAEHLSVLSRNLISLRVFEYVALQYFQTHSMKFASEFELFQNLEGLLKDSFAQTRMMEGENDVKKFLNQLMTRKNLNAFCSSDAVAQAKCTALEAESPLLIFALAHRAEDGDLCVSPSRVANEDMLNMLVVVPYGDSCAESCLWNEVWQQVSHEGNGCTETTTTLLEFIVSNAEDLKQRRPHTKYYCYDLCTDDCIPVPTQLPSLSEMEQALKEGSFLLLGAWCVSAAVGCFDQAEFQDTLNNLFLKIFEIGGIGGHDQLLRYALDVSLGLPKEIQHIAVKMCIEGVALSSKIPMSAVYCSLMDRLICGSLYASLHECNRRMKQLAVMSCANAEMSELRSYLPRLIKTAFVVAPPQLKSDPNASGAGSDHPSLNLGRDQSNNIIAADTPAGIQTDVVGSVESSEVSPRAAVINLLQTDFIATRGTPAEKKLQSVLEKIAGDLYSSNVHFVMELIQNADDNSYQEGVKASLHFELYPHAVVVYNNERGFNEDNMKALCNVSASTKVGQPGYIGQKGIGFKSVFSVSDSPEVHSNGYHFKFNRQNMIEPIWMDEDADNNIYYPKRPDHLNDTFKTIIRLPLDEKTRANIPKLQYSFDEAFDPKLLLFLNQLQNILLDDRCRNQTTQHRKLILSEGWTQILSDSPNDVVVETLWFIRRDKFKPSVQRSERQVESTEVAVAFQFKIVKSTVVHDKELVGGNIEDNEDAHPSIRECGTAPCHEGLIHELKLECNQLLPVYAYLPTKNLMFRFIIQGDFLLSSSRESLHEDDVWNRALLNRVADLYVDAIVEMFDARWAQDKCEAELVVDDHGRYFDKLDKCAYNVKLTTADILSLLPREQHISSSGVFQQFIKRVYSSLKTKPIFKSRDGERVVSCKDVYRTDHLPFDPGVAEELLYKNTGKCFLDDSVKLDEDLCTMLEIPKFTALDAVSCLEMLSFNDPSSLHIGTISELLVLIAQFFSTPASSSFGGWRSCVKPTAPRMKQIPSQVLKAGAKVFEPSKSSHALIQPSDAALLLDKLRTLRIWPTGNGQFTSLSTATILIGQGVENEFSKNELVCLNVFKSMLPILDSSLLAAADKFVKSGSTLVKNLLLTNLKKTSGHGNGGGFAELNRSTIVKNFIVPFYSSNEVDKTSREMAAALVAFLYLANSDNLSELPHILKKSGVYCPLLCATSSGNWESKDIVHLDTTGLLRPASSDSQSESEPVDFHDAVSQEVHFGLEISESAANLIKMPSAFRQMSFRILDPLCAAYALGKEADIDNTQSLTRFDSTYKFGVSNANWEKFLSKIGVCNMFTVRRSGNKVWEAPALVQIVRHLNQHGRPLVTITNSNMEGSRTENTALHLPPNPAAVGTGTGMAAASHVPLFLPHLNDGAVEVTKEVFHSMQALLRILVNDVKYCSHSDAMLKFLDSLNDLPWFPAQLHQWFFGEKGHRRYVLSSPRNVFLQENNEPKENMTMENSLGPHALYVSYEEANKIAGCPKLLRHLKFARVAISRSAVLYDGSLLLNLFEWMLYSQSNGKMLSSSYVMEHIYKGLLGISSDPTLVKMLNTLPCLWIPDSKPSNPADCDVEAILSGSFQPLDRFVLDDTSKSFSEMDNSATPLFVFSEYYDKESEMRKLFGRKVCNICKAYEGMFGSKGTCPESSVGGGSLRCMCKDAGFGKSTNGMIKSSPSAMDTLQLLQYYNARCCDSVDDKEKSLCKAYISSILRELSANIWKCFHVRLCIHPYSAATLETLKNEFRTLATFPTITGDFVSIAHAAQNKIHLFAINQPSIYSQFKEELMGLSSAGYHFIDAEACEVTNFDANTLQGSQEYDLHELEESRKNLLEFPFDRFREVTSKAPIEFHNAPKNLICLLQYLEVPMLSDYVHDEYYPDVCSSSDSSSKNCAFMTTMNYLLHLCQLYFNTHEKEVLRIGDSKGFNRLLNLDIVECSCIRGKITLALDEISASKTYELHYRISTEKAERSTVYVNSDQISPQQCNEKALALVLNTIRIEVAILMGKQQYDLMEELRKYLSKYVQIKSKDVEFVVDAENLEHIPSTVSLWQLKFGCGTKSDTSLENEDMENLETIAPETLAMLEGYANASAELRNEPRFDSGKTQSKFVNPDVERSRSVCMTEVDDQLNNCVESKELLEIPSVAVVVIDSHDSAQFRQSNGDKESKLSNSIINNVDGSGGGTTGRVDRLPGDEVAASGNIRDGGIVYSECERVVDGTGISQHRSLSGVSHSYNLLNTVADSKDLADLLQHLGKSGYDPTAGEAAIGVDTISSGGDYSTGRFGEKLIISLLDRWMKDASVGELRDIVSLEWVNEKCESGKPYDIQINMSGGSVRYCEVKTRSVLDGAVSNSWFISPLEVDFALKNQESYFVFGVCLGLSEEKVVSLRANAIGMESGLMEALRCGDAHLVLRNN